MAGTCRGATKPSTSIWRSISAARALPRRPRQLPCRATSGGGSVEEAVQTVEACLALFGARQLDQLSAFLPDGVIDACLERRREARAAAAAAEARLDSFVDASGGRPSAAAAGDDGSITFQELMSAARPEELHLDAYATRTLVCTPQASAQALSSLRPGPTSFLQRVELRAASGEEAVLTFTLQLQESLQPKYRGFQSVQQWFLQSITGEPADPDLPTAPDPRWGPESVVSAQLDALAREDTAAVFALASPDNQSATGPVPAFEAMLRQGAYLSLVGNRGARLLRSVQTRCDRTLVIVGVEASAEAVELGAPTRAAFAWVVGLQQGHHVGAVRNCWLTEAVQPVSGGLYQEYSP